MAQEILWVCLQKECIMNNAKMFVFWTILGILNLVSIGIMLNTNSPDNMISVPILMLLISIFQMYRFI